MHTAVCSGGHDLIVLPVRCRSIRSERTRSRESGKGVRWVLTGDERADRPRPRKILRRDLRVRVGLEAMKVTGQCQVHVFQCSQSLGNGV